MPILIDPVATHARTKPAALAVGDLENGRRWSYRELDIAIDHAAAWLVERLGPATGRRVATLCQNSPEMLILQLACTRAGAIFAPLNWRLAEPELRGLCADCEPSLLFCDGRFADVARAVSDALCTVFDLDAAPGRLVSIVGESASGPPHGARRPFDSCATLLYTSGTSGRPKGVIVTEEMAFWGCTNFILGNDVSFRSVFLCDMPMFHTAGLYAAVRTPLIAGGTVLISSGFDAIRTRQRLADPALGVTHYFSVPQMAQMMWQAPGFDPVMLRGLTVYAMGGAPNPAAQIERFVRAGIRMSDGFGMSETGSNFGMPVADFDVILAKAGSCGLPYLAVQARIVDEAGSDLPPGEAGELWLRGPSITSGYWNRPEKTAKAFKDGWFRTGDAAYRDVDGFYFLIDRKKDMYISGGENVYPAEVEAVVLELDSVAEVAVIGVPDARWGEVGRAYVLARAGIALESDTVIAHCRARLAKYKIPASVVITDDIPRTASGKVQKHLLKARALDELEKR
ncbi:MAG: AMP-binding protein [Alphaproteobacteria bacterium]|nr:AMP-binding protein [Alphaproteobacteria bacterium]